MVTVRPPNSAQTIQDPSDPRMAFQALLEAQNSFGSASNGLQTAFIDNPLAKQKQEFNAIKAADERIMQQGLQAAKAGGSQAQLDWLNGGADRLMSTLQNKQGIDQTAEFADRDALRNNMSSVLENEEAIKSGPLDEEQRGNLTFAQEFTAKEKSLIDQTFNSQVKARIDGLGEEVDGGFVKYNPVIGSYSSIAGPEDAVALNAMVADTSGTEDLAEGTEKSDILRMLQEGYRKAGGKGEITTAHLSAALAPIKDDPFFLQFTGNEYYEPGKNTEKLGEYYAAQERLSKQANTIQQTAAVERDAQFSVLDNKLKEFQTKQGENNLRRYYGNDITKVEMDTAGSLQRLRAAAEEAGISKAETTKRTAKADAARKDADSKATTEAGKEAIADADKVVLGSGSQDTEQPSINNFAAFLNGQPQETESALNQQTATSNRDASGLFVPTSSNGQDIPAVQDIRDVFKGYFGFVDKAEEGVAKGANPDKYFGPMSSAWDSLSANRKLEVLEESVRSGANTTQKRKDKIAALKEKMSKSLIASN